MKESTHNRLGRVMLGLPIPPVAENCVAVEAGPVRLVVESRLLTDEIIRGVFPDAELSDDPAERYDDYGASLHVFDAGDGTERLRFDCFADEPHYHYLRDPNATGVNLVCRLDEIAQGDPIEWVLSRLQHRLPEMLAFAEAPELAEQVRARHDEVLAALGEVSGLLNRAQGKATSSRTGGTPSGVAG